MSLLSASKLDLASKCLGSFTLPWNEERNQWSDAGNERHAEDEAAINRGDIPTALAERWPNHTWRAEVAFAYDVATGEARELGQGIKRDYARFNLTPFEVVGTLDTLGMDSTGHLVCHDKKSHEDQGPIREHLQLRFNALAATRALGATRTEIALTHELYPLTACDLDAFDLDETAFAVKRLMIDVAKARSDARDGKPIQFNTGRQCRWCAAFSSCPKQSDLVQLVRKEDAAMQRLETTLPVLSAENAPEVYDLWKRIVVLGKRVHQSLIAYAAVQPIPLGDNRWYGKHVTNGNRSYDGRVAHEVLTAKYGREFADSVVEMSVTQKALEDKIKTVAPKGAAAAAKRAVLDEIEARGGMERKRSEKIEEYVSELRLAGGDE